MKDNYGRNIDYMRLSITDRCNMRCRYCMPDGIEKISMSEILSYEEILRVAEAATGLGITKFRVTGGEPLVRLGCPSFIKELKALPGVEHVSITTNGMELAKYIDELRDAKVDAVNISLDTMDAEKFRYITQCGDLDKVMEGLLASVSSGIKTRINCVPQKHLNEDEIRDFAKLAFELGIDVRFIEMMPVGIASSDEGVSNEQILATLKETYHALAPDERVHGYGPAVYYHIEGENGGIGFISAIHGKFCDKCNRLRLTSQGLIKPCLSYEDAVDVRPALSGSIEDIAALIRQAILNKPKEHCFDSQNDNIERRPMSEIGG